MAVTESATPEVRLDGLEQNRCYFFRVRSRNSQGWSEWGPQSACLAVAPVAPPSVPIIISCESHCVELSFEPAPGPLVERYELRYSRRPRRTEQDDNDILAAPAREDRWFVYSDCIAKTRVKVADLRPLQVYRFQVRGRTVVGWSRWSGTSEAVCTDRRL
jgi:hypothetical protein